MVVAISKKICDCYAHPCKFKYKMRSKGPIYNKFNSQLPRVIMFVYAIQFGRSIAYWKGLSDIFNFQMWPNEFQRKLFGHLNCQKTLFRASKKF